MAPHSRKPHAIIGLGKSFAEVFSGIWDGIVSGLKWVINKCVDGLNWLTGKISSALTIEVPDWVPGFGGDTWGINIPKIPNWNYEGAIFTKPTVLGNGQGVGDKYNGQGSNPEAIIPLDILWDKMDAIINRQPIVIISADELVDKTAYKMKDRLDRLELRNVSYQY